MKNINKVSTSHVCLAISLLLCYSLKVQRGLQLNLTCVLLSSGIYIVSHNNIRSVCGRWSNNIRLLDGNSYGGLTLVCTNILYRANLAIWATPTKVQLVYLLVSATYTILKVRVCCNLYNCRIFLADWSCSSCSSAIANCHIDRTHKHKRLPN